MKVKEIAATLVGHPFAPIGRGEDIRSSFLAFKKVGLLLPVHDVYSFYDDRDRDIADYLSDHLADHLSDNVNIFFINGDEVGPVLSRVRNKLPEGAYNIVFPAWELSDFPVEWVVELERFDEVWAQSQFVYESLRKAVTKPIYHMSLASEISLSRFLGRRYFGIPESSFAFLFFFDFGSYMERKNPFAVLKSFERVCSRKAYADVRMVMKVSGADQKPEEFRLFESRLADHAFREKVVIINQVLNRTEMGNLINCCDSFVSLHRSEGFGRGMAEAMYLGKPVIATGYSGNLDFMNEENSCLVRYQLVPVREGQYPHGAGQVWAEADVEHAAYCMIKVMEDRYFGRRLGAAASRHIRTFFSYRAIGLKYGERLKELLK